ncbi:RNA polymerase subunit sigma-70 [Pedobacter yulinensis]|uniref:RNA polymerase subunit sigma-70 n=2 Tax=Pedobacter yulinensis TaxID=2126353 RepID=A0A2T3HM91_9SPHI|nr:RNA polymerase subunit sigma-70 [Pedobacter yulinensis]
MSAQELLSFVETDNESLRPVLIRYAYAICGTVADAEDLVQDLFLNLLNKDLSGVADRRAYLIRSIVNRAIDRKKLIRSQLDMYPGDWLPEPQATDTADHRIIQKETLSYALMVLLEHLDPRQRAVFILKEAFAYSHEEIASILGIRAPFSRQLLSRGKKLLASVQRKGEQMASRRFLERYLQVMSSGDTKSLEALLLEDIVVFSDGGGKARAALNAIEGHRRVMGLLFGLYRKFNPQCTLQYGTLNGAPALIYLINNVPVKCQLVTEKDGRICRIFMIRNPDKLRNLKF